MKIQTIYGALHCVLLWFHGYLPNAGIMINCISSAFAQGFQEDILPEVKGNWVITKIWNISRGLLTSCQDSIVDCYKFNAINIRCSTLQVSSRLGIVCSYSEVAWEKHWSFENCSYICSNDHSFLFNVSLSSHLDQQWQQQQVSCLNCMFNNYNLSICCLITNTCTVALLLLWNTYFTMLIYWCIL